MSFILLNKPFRVLSQFRDEQQRSTLADFVDLPDVYPAGRLDFDSEGLLALTDDGRLQAAIAEPSHKLEKIYWAQVEGHVGAEHLERLLLGVRLKDGVARAVKARKIAAPASLWGRDPPIRHRPSVPDSWLELSIQEGRNRQVRRMTAAAGLPTLRLIRSQIGPWSLQQLQPGDYREMTSAEAARQLQAWQQSNQ